MEDFTPDPAEISKAVEEQLDTMSAQLAQNNLTLDDYCKFSNSTLEQLREDARPGAKKSRAHQGARPPRGAGGGAARA